MASTNTSNESETTALPGPLRLVIYGLLAAIAASVVNVIVLYVGLAAVEYPPEFVGGQFGPLAVGPVAVNSTVAAVGATLAYGVIIRYAARPDRTFTIVAGTVLVASFAMFLAPDLAGAPLAVFATLAMMHVVAAAVIVGVLTRASESEGR